MNADVTEWDGFRELDGCVYKSDKYHIGVKMSLDPYKKRYVVCHELGHIRDGTIGMIGTRIAEWRADTEAEDILIPDSRLQEAIAEYGEDYAHYPELFGVSHDTFLKKIKRFAKEFTL